MSTLHDRAMHQLGAEICRGEFPVGEVLPTEPALGEHLAVSRIVVREVIKSLVAKGMLEVRRKTGTVVCDPTNWNLFDPAIITWRARTPVLNATLARDLMELRRIVEPAAARLAAERADAAQRLALREAYEGMRRAVGGDGDYVEADLAFHSVILHACQNQFLQQMQMVLSAILRTSFEIVSTVPDGPASSLGLHEDLCIAIEAASPEAAERAVLRLTERAERDLRERLALTATGD
ncbi:MAG: FadR/GntR family transcriptional regulator [Rhodocyclaceae bacterium]